MSLNVIGASTLKRFTAAITEGFRGLNQHAEFDLIQIHASPASRSEDLEILETSQKSQRKKLFLIHRPDELLLCPELLQLIEKNEKMNLIFFGDLLLSHPFWNKRKNNISIIPHPFFSLDLPQLYGGKQIIGAFTSWGEMRSLEHYLKLLEALIKQDHSQRFIGMIGGWLGGRNLERVDLEKGISAHKLNITIDKDLILSLPAFIPHVNVQLYHLDGRKRLGESSGSLHSGISLPVIFEANGVERIEGIKVIKMRADEKLHVIDYEDAAKEILSSHLDSILLNNLNLAKKNTAQVFCEKVIKLGNPK